MNPDLHQLADAVRRLPQRDRRIVLAAPWTTDRTIPARARAIGIVRLQRPDGPLRAALVDLFVADTDADRLVAAERLAGALERLPETGSRDLGHALFHAARRTGSAGVAAVLHAVGVVALDVADAARDEMSPFVADMADDDGVVGRIDADMTTTE